MTEQHIELDSIDTALLVFGSCDQNIRMLEQEFEVTAVCRGAENQTFRGTGKRGMCSQSGGRNADFDCQQNTTGRTNGSLLHFSGTLRGRRKSV